MFFLPGYHIIELIYKSTNSLVYRARKESNNQLVILKILNQERPPLKNLIRYKQEYQITKCLKSDNIIKVYDFLNCQNTLVIILEDFGGISLDKLLKKQKFTPSEFLNLAVKIINGLSVIHTSNIIHKDINPSNIVFNPESGQVKIIDFGISTVLPRENFTLKNPKILQGTLAYISPEQTGRMNRSLDYRTDFYSLGITFYEILTGKLPFDAIDPLDWIHSHIAIHPLQPHQVNPNVDPILSNIIVKLIAKNAEDRYQSAWGIKADLENCLYQLEAQGEIKVFELGKKDITDKLQVSQKIYGRDEEIKILLNTFKRVSQGNNELILISGFSGIGKSALVREIYKPITEAKGYFIAGKFEQYQRDIPYRAIAQAFEQLVEYLLVEPEDSLRQWRTKILNVLGINAQVIIEIIPKLQIILGKQPEVSSLPAKEAENRFNIVFQKFIKVVTRPEHALVIFLDDLQWADSASLRLIQLLMTGVDSKCLFLIGAYRDNEVNAVHPLMSTINEIDKAGGTISRISLSPLKLFHIKSLILDSFNCTQNQAKSLGELILAKTDGNPFFINEFLRSLYKENLLYFDHYLGRWEWNILAIKAQDITDNVVELLSLKIKKLKPEIQEILKLAACIGNQFEIKILATILGESLQETALLLQETIVANLIIPLSYTSRAIELNIPTDKNELKVEYKFIHDRIQQASYSLIPYQERSRVHKKIGELLLKQFTSLKPECKIFDIVNQLNFSISLIECQSEKYELANLNLTAARRAKLSAAYKTALQYLKRGIELLGKSSWQEQYNLTLSLYVEAAETAYLSAEFEQMDQWIEEVLKQAEMLLDKVRVYQIKIESLKAQNKLMEGLETGISVLKRLGIKLPMYSNKILILLEYIGTKFVLAGKSTKDLIDLPIMTDPYKLAAMEILDAIASAAYFAFPTMYPIIVFKRLNLSVKYGNSSISNAAYATYGQILCAVTGEINLGYQFGQLALRLLKKFNTEKYGAKTSLRINGFIKHWKEHIQQTLSPLLEGYQSGQETGDLEYAFYNILVYLSNCYYIGKELTELEFEIKNYIKVVFRFRQETITDSLKILLQTVSNLTNIVENPCLLVGKDYDENQMLLFHQKTNNRTAIFSLHFYKLMLCYLFEDYFRAGKYSIIAEKELNSVISLAATPIFYFYCSLNLIKLYTKTFPHPQKNISKIIINQRKMKKWAKYAPMNYQHKYDLVEAEKHRVLGHKIKAIELYNRAIEGAKKNQYLQEEALAYELAAKFYLEWGKYIIAQAYMLEARYRYLLWGAKTKVKHLEKNYSELLQENRIKFKKNNIFSTNSSSSFNSDILDGNTLLKVSKAISQEKDLDKLLKKLLQFSLQNVGAQTGLIIFEKDARFIVEATGGKSDDNQINILVSSLDSEPQQFPEKIINYVRRTLEPIILNNACAEGIFVEDLYIQEYKTKSVLCLPLLNLGKFRGVIYLENNLVEGVFNEEQLLLLNIIATQAANSLEVAQLRNRATEKAYKYKVGGCLDSNSPSYVTRQADIDLYEGIKAGNFCYVFNSRQVGKSSLRIPIVNKLQQEGFSCVAVDLTAIGFKNCSVEQWYSGLIFQLVQEFNLSEKFDFRSWRGTVDFLSPVQQLKEFITKVLLKEISTNIVIFLDEIDSTLSLNFSMDDFFALIRFFYNFRLDYSEYERLSFVLLGVATPSNLIQDKNCTPFNIGQPIALEPFQLHEVEPLMKGLAIKYRNPQTLLKEVLVWTGGQPLLTQKVCNLIFNYSNTLVEGQEVEWISNIVQSKIIKNWTSQDQPEHLKTIRDRIIYSKLPVKLLELYQKILQEGEIKANESPEQMDLLLSGLVRRFQENLRVSNRIYQSVFNQDWITQTLDNLRK